MASELRRRFQPKDDLFKQWDVLFPKVKPQEQGVIIRRSSGATHTQTLTGAISKS